MPAEKSPVAPGLPGHHGDLPPSKWVVQWSSRIAPGSTVLDLACGAGRHALWLAAQGFQVLAVDVDLSRFTRSHAGISLLQADLENAPWPLLGHEFDGVVVTNYLHREHFSELLACVRPEGVLIYETFASGNERFGKPSNPKFLLQPGELLGRLKD